MRSRGVIQNPRYGLPSPAAVSPKRYFSYLSNHFSRCEQNELDREKVFDPSPMARRLQLRQCVFVKNKVILRGQKIVSRENQKIIRFGAEKSGGGWSLSLQWRHDTWNAFTVLFTGDAIKQFEPLKSLGNTKCFQSVALESRILNEEVQR